MRHADGTWRWVMTRGLAIRGLDGMPTRMAGSLSDITDRRIAQLRLQHDALHDTLTGLPNRTLFVDRLNQILQRSQRDPSCRLRGPVPRHRPLQAGQRQPQPRGRRQPAGRARRPRLGRAAPRGHGGAAGRRRVHRAARRRRRPPTTPPWSPSGSCTRSTTPFNIDGNELFVSASIGIALSAPGLGPADLMRNADIAMYDAKRRGRARQRGVRREHAPPGRRPPGPRERAAPGRRVLAAGHPLPADHRPRHRARSAAWRRWPAGPPTGPPVPPAEFIPIAEETGVIGALGQQVMRGALRTLAGWRADGLVVRRGVHERQPVGPPARRSRAGRAGPRGDRGRRPARPGAQARDHREHADAGGRAHPARVLRGLRHAASGCTWTTSAPATRR